MSRKAVTICFLALLVCGISGCVQETTNGDTRVYSYALWVPLVALLGSLAALPAGWAMRERVPRLGWGLMIGGVLVLIGLVPSLFLEKTIVSDKTFSVNTGIWGMTSVHSVDFADLASVNITKETSIGRRGRRNTNFYLVCYRKGGTNAKIPLNTITKEAAPAFIAKAQSLNVPIIDQTQ